jgi:hypothetical protein
MFDSETLPLLSKALTKMGEGFAHLPTAPSAGDASAMETVLLRLAEKMQDNYPYFHPYYAGQMLKPPHPMARLAYMLSMYINPNNQADVLLDHTRLFQNLTGTFKKGFSYDLIPFAYNEGNPILGVVFVLLVVNVRKIVSTHCATLPRYLSIWSPSGDVG